MCENEISETKETEFNWAKKISEPLCQRCLKTTDQLFKIEKFKTCELCSLYGTIDMSDYKRNKEFLETNSDLFKIFCFDPLWKTICNNCLQTVREILRRFPYLKNYSISTEEFYNISLCLLGGKCFSCNKKFEICKVERIDINPFLFDDSKTISTLWKTLLCGDCTQGLYEEENRRKIRLTKNNYLWQYHLFLKKRKDKDLKKHFETVEIHCMVCRSDLDFSNSKNSCGKICYGSVCKGINSLFGHSYTICSDCEKSLRNKFSFRSPGNKFNIVPPNESSICYICFEKEEETDESKIFKQCFPEKRVNISTPNGNGFRYYKYIELNDKYTARRYWTNFPSVEILESSKGQSKVEMFAKIFKDKNGYKRIILSDFPNTYVRRGWGLYPNHFKSLRKEMIKDEQSNQIKKSKIELD
jgi:hypothetical protein